MDRNVGSDPPPPPPRPPGRILRRRRRDPPLSPVFSTRTLKKSGRESPDIQWSSSEESPLSPPHRPVPPPTSGGGGKPPPLSLCTYLHFNIVLNVRTKAGRRTEKPPPLLLALEARPAGAALLALPFRTVNLFIVLKKKREKSSICTARLMKCFRRAQFFKPLLIGRRVQSSHDALRV